MSALSIQPTYPIFTDIDGQPLDEGYIWIGTANLNPITNPIAVYWDAALTLPAVQPIRTVSGYPSNAGTPGRLYVNSDYSIQVQNKNGTVVYSSPTATERYSDVVILILASNVLTTIGYTGGVQRNQQAVNDDMVCVFDFMTPVQIAAVKAGTSTEDLSTPFQNAIATAKRVYIPKGRYRVNVIINNKTILEGDGSTSTILQPYDDAVATLTYTFAAMLSPQFSYWNYHSEVRGIQFNGKTTKTGIGFTFAQTNPSNYQTDDEYANNVKFYGCKFSNLEKGIQFPFGNIGSEFYSCGFQGNKYGVYTLNNKFGGIMHAGNKYFYAGEMSLNECAFYCNNTADGFGAIIFDNTIFEYNNIAAYIFQNFVTYVPITFNGVWFEGNGGGVSTVTIDSWSGTTKSTQTVTARTLIFDGTQGSFVCNNSGVCGELQIKGTDTTVTFNNCRVESAPGFGGGGAIIDYPDSSSVLMFNCYSNGGVIRGNSQVCMTPPNLKDSVIDSSPTRSGVRAFQIISRSSKLTDYGPSRAMSASLTTAASTTGSFSLTGSVVSDGIIYDECNEFTRAAFALNEFTTLSSPSSGITTSAGYYVFTIDLKITQGTMYVYVWNQSTAQFATFVSAPALNKWFTFAAIAYSPGSQSLSLDFGGANVDTTWRVSAYQIHRFDSYQQAQSFLMSGVFAES